MTSMSLRTQRLHIGGMDCGNCAKTVAASVQQLPGVAEATVSFATGRLEVSYNPQAVTEAAICDRIRTLGYTIEPDSMPESVLDSEATEASIRSIPPEIGGWAFWLRHRRGQTVLLAGVGLLLGLIATGWGIPVWLTRCFYGLSILIGGYPVARAGLMELRLRRADMNLLMTLSVIGAVFLGDWLEGASVVVLFALGTTLQTVVFGRTRQAIRGLMNLTPAMATVQRQGQDVSVPVDTIQVGDILTVRPGQRIALDGRIVSGYSTIDQSPITGESVPEEKAPGDLVYGGTINQAGFLEVEVTHHSQDTTVATIIHRVEEAQASRAPSQQWVDRFATIYTPLVIGGAIALAFIPPLVLAQPLTTWVYRALVLLVIACPCALVISTPVSIVSAIGAATRQGVLFKDGSALETAGRLTTLALDKTGTITQGIPLVQQIYPWEDAPPIEVLSIAASLERQSEHPLARAIVAYARQKGIPLATPHSFQAIPGKGIQAVLSDRPYWVGNRRLLIDQGGTVSEAVESWLTAIETAGHSAVLVGSGVQLLGAIALADGVRLEAAEAIHHLRQVGVNRLIMLTGDRSAVARAIAQQVNLSDYRAELLPDDKLQTIQALRQSPECQDLRSTRSTFQHPPRKRLEVVGMVGDGINDAPALATADVSFALGNLDITLDTADVVLVGHDLRKLAYAVDLGRRTRSVIQQNVIFSLITKGLFLGLATVGSVGLAIAVLADMGTSLAVTANGMRLFHSKP